MVIFVITISILLNIIMSTLSLRFVQYILYTIRTQCGNGTQKNQIIQRWIYIVMYIHLWILFCSFKYSHQHYFSHTAAFLFWWMKCWRHTFYTLHCIATRNKTHLQIHKQQTYANQPAWVNFFSLKVYLKVVMESINKLIVCCPWDCDLHFGLKNFIHIWFWPAKNQHNSIVIVSMLAWWC